MISADAVLPAMSWATAGSVEGGDIHMIRPGLLVVGYSGERTTLEGARQVGGWYEDAGWEVKVTPWFTASGIESGVADSRKFTSVAFSMEPNEISEIQELDDGYYIEQVVEKDPGRIPELSEVKEKVERDLIREKQSASAESDAKKLLASLKEKGESALTAEGKKYVFQSTGFFERNKAIPEIGWERDLSQAAFQLSTNKPYADDVIQGGKGFYVIRLKDRRLPEMQEYDKEKTAIKERLLSQKKMQALDTWLQQVKNDSEITIQEGFQ